MSWRQDFSAKNLAPVLSGKVPLAAACMSIWAKVKQEAQVARLRPYRSQRIRRSGHAGECFPVVGVPRVECLRVPGGMILTDHNGLRQA